MMKAVDDESGVALGLAIIVVMVVGVMGAGLLVFMRNDLASVIRVNQGQRAFYAADAGVEAAKRELLGNASPAKYDDDNASGSCDSPLDSEVSTSSEWSPERGGAERSFADGEFVAEVRWLGAGCDFPSGGDTNAEYFEIVSTGTSGEAKRRVEAVYAASDTRAPLANFAAGDVRIGTGAVVNGVSVFSGGDVSLANSGSLRGTDKVYGRWEAGGSPRSVNTAGAGAVGGISGYRLRVGTRDFDGASTPPFVGGNPGAGELSFPFDPKHWQNVSALELLKEEAMDQGNHRTSGGSLPWPESSSESTVVYIEFTGLPGNVELSSTRCGAAAKCRGVLVVENGSVAMRNGSVFRGAVVAAGGERSESLSVFVEGGATLEGFANSSGTMDVSGEVRSLGRKDAMRHPGFHAMKIWSWRELYE